jgi:hypothetical protein
MRTAASLRREQYSASGSVRQFDLLNLSDFAKRKVKLTSTIPTNTIDSCIIAHLEHSLVARPASAVMSTMPPSTHSVSNLPLIFTVANCNYLSNDFMSRNTRKNLITEMTLLEKAIRVADAARKYLDQNLA